ncbi:MAG: hypothetical protein K0R14_1273 [Burkholderiales bacterium]|jgi:hypothetical protein|nr:hypothetical protein [Burkholderiales bacterium]
MKILLSTFVFILSICLISCSSRHPEYIPQQNTYTFDYLNSSNGSLQNKSLISTFNVESIEQTYYTAFCAWLKNCSGNISNVKNSPLFGGFDLSQKPISQNKLGIKNINLYRLSYLTTGQNHELRKVSGAVFIPAIPTNKIKGVVLYFHKTYFARTSTPSFDITNKSPDNAVIASVFATNGYIVIAPDYIGQGIDNTVPHPFILYPLVNANDGLSMLTATRKFLDDMGLTTSLPLFITGFSEGASYALWFSRLYQEQARFKEQTDATNFKLTLVAPMSGAYNISNVTYNYLFDNVSTFSKDTYRAYSSVIAAKLKPGLFAFAMIGYAFYDKDNDCDKVLNHDFCAMKCTWQDQKKCNYKDKNMPLAEIFNQSDDMEILNKIANAASLKYSNSKLFTGQTNNLIPLLNPAMINDKKFFDILRASDIYYWHSTVPTTLIYLKNDSVVSPYNTEYAYQGMLENKSTNLKKIEMDNNLIKADVVSYLPNFEAIHPISMPYLALIALKEFNQVIGK